MVPSRDRPDDRTVSDLIHDLQTPLMALRAIRRDEVSPEAHALLQGAIESIARVVKGSRDPKPALAVPIEPQAASAEVEEIRVPHGAVIAVLDDDPTVHEVWKRRFAELPAGAIERVVEARSPREMRLAMREFPDLFLLDHDLAGFTETGLDLIIELGIAKQAWLVTGRALEPALQARCDRHGVRLLAKDRLASVRLAGAGGISAG